MDAAEYPRILQDKPTCVGPALLLIPDLLLLLNDIEELHDTLRR